MKVISNLKQNAQIAVESVLGEVKGVKAVVISTEDGFEVAARVENTAQVTRLSAMASSLAALGALAGEESHLGACEDVIIQAVGGIIVILQIPHPSGALIMSVVAGRDAVIGQMLYFSKQAARTLQNSC